MQINKAYLLIKNYGVRYTISFIINYLFSKIGIFSEIELVKMKINKDISKDYNNIIQYGVFKGMKMSEKVWWGKFDLANKIFGQYETHVINKITELSKITIFL